MWKLEARTNPDLSKTVTAFKYGVLKFQKTFPKAWTEKEAVDDTRVDLREVWN